MLQPNTGGHFDLALTAKWDLPLLSTRIPRILMTVLRAKHLSSAGVISSSLLFRHACCKESAPNGRPCSAAELAQGAAPVLQLYSTVGDNEGVASTPQNGLWAESLTPSQGSLSTPGLEKRRCHNASHIVPHGGAAHAPCWAPFTVRASKQAHHAPHQNSGAPHRKWSCFPEPGAAIRSRTIHNVRARAYTQSR